MPSKADKIAALQQLVKAVVKKEQAKREKQKKGRTRGTTPAHDGPGLSTSAEMFTASSRDPLNSIPSNAISHRKVAIDELLCGHYRSTEGGQIFMVEEQYPLPYRHGSMALNDAFCISADDLIKITGNTSFEHFDLRQTVFLDTETTGLSFSSGTYVFLVGVGFFSADEFIVRQYFMQHYDQEESLVLILEQDLAGFDYLVTFNGTHFDLPLLKMRFLMQGRDFTLHLKPHCDLLLYARKLWKKRLRWCNLGNLERQLLGIDRVDDVPGGQIPELYTTFIRENDGQVLERVFYHNKIDILSLVTLLTLTCQTLNFQKYGRQLSATELYSIALLEISRDKTDLAVPLLKLALENSDTPDLSADILYTLASMFKRRADFDQACACWNDMIDRTGTTDLRPHLELAKYWEHVRKIYQKALDHCHAALDILDQPPYRSFPEKRDQLTTQWVHRLERLNKKIASQ